MTAAAQIEPHCRVGLLLDGREVSKDVHDFVAWAGGRADLKVTNFVLTQDKARASSSFIPRLLFRLVAAIEQLLLGRNARYGGHGSQYGLPPLDVTGFDPAAANAGEGVAALGLDLVVSFAAGASARALAQAARVDVVSLSCEGLDGFWPAYSGDDTTRFSIRYFAASGKDETLLRGRVATQYYYLLNRAALREKANHYLKTIVAKFAASRELTPAHSYAPQALDDSSFPTALRSLFYLARLFCRVSVRLARKILSLDYRWNVGFVAADWRNALEHRSPIRAIANPPGRYLADPFIARKDGRHVCFVEDYDLATRRGRISAYGLNDNGASFLGVAISEDFHLSFPYVFDYQGALYMCPETSEAGEIRIYKCAEFPLRWALEKVIMTDVSAVDTMLFEKGGKWWMLTNIDPGLGDFQLELSLFSANSPLAEEWAPHARNPVVVDAARARNGGLVRDGDRLFRVAQRQGFDFYGRSTSVNEIIRIDDDDYVENCVAEVLPAFEPGAVGTHHLHSDGVVTVLDFARLGRMR